MPKRSKQQTEGSISMWGEFGPGDGSPNFLKMLDGRRSQSKKVPVDTKGPVLFFCHWARASAWRVTFVTRLYAPWEMFKCNRSSNNVNTYFPAMSAEGTLLNITVVRGWSDRFLPTLGRFKTLLIPMLVNVFWFPIPEFNRICGVLIAPAERMTSFVAVNLLLSIFHEYMR